MKKKRKKKNFNDLVRIMRKLRGPYGCPWDRKQTHASLLKYLREESQEVGLAVRRKDWKNLKEELGDVLLQIVFHAEISRQAGRFGIGDVVNGLSRKLIRRHPHVFRRKKGENLSAKEVVRRWNIMKDIEERRR